MSLRTQSIKLELWIGKVNKNNCDYCGSLRYQNKCHQCGASGAEYEPPKLEVKSSSVVSADDKIHSVINRFIRDSGFPKKVRVSYEDYIRLVTTRIGDTHFTLFQFIQNNNVTGGKIDIKPDRFYTDISLEGI